MRFNDVYVQICNNNIIDRSSLRRSLWPSRSLRGPYTTTRRVRHTNVAKSRTFTTVVARRVKYTIIYTWNETERRLINTLYAQKSLKRKTVRLPTTCRHETRGIGGTRRTAAAIQLYNSIPAVYHTPGLLIFYTSCGAKAADSDRWKKNHYPPPTLRSAAHTKSSLEVRDFKSVPEFLHSKTSHHVHVPCEV